MSSEVCHRSTGKAIEGTGQAGTGMAPPIPVPVNSRVALAVLVLVLGLTGWLVLWRRPTPG